MLRRVVRVSRLCLFALGVLLLVLLSVNCLGAYGYVRAPGTTIGTVRGQAFLWIANEGFEGEGFYVSYTWSDELRWPIWWLFKLERPAGVGRPFSVMIYVPLWLLAVLCLAWPVTSFLLARRRRQRGFEVELAPAAPLPPGEVPAQPAGEGPRPRGRVV